MITKKNNNNAKFVSAWMDRCHELELEIVKLKNKPKVAKTFIEEWRNKIGSYYDIIYDWQGWYNALPERLKQMLVEAGVKVEK